MLLQVALTSLFQIRKGNQKSPLNKIITIFKIFKKDYLGLLFCNDVKNGSVNPHLSLKETLKRKET